MSPARIVIIAKAPIAGFAKTRLIPALGADGAARLARSLLERTVRTALDARLGAVELCVTPALGHPVWPTLDLPAGLDWSEQGEGGLGTRMAHAAQRTITRGETAILIGADCPELTPTHLQAAAAALHEHDAALVPSADGGYALLAIRRFHPLLFTAMPWSTDVVARETLRRIGRLGWTVKSFPSVHDVDLPADLPRLHGLLHGF